MNKVHVFNAGPCLLPQVAYDKAIEAIKDFKGTGVSLLSISHRSKEWDALSGKNFSIFPTTMKCSSSEAEPACNSSALQ